MQGKNMFLSIVLAERPRIGKISFSGVSKTQEEDLRKKNQPDWWDGLDSGKAKKCQAGYQELFLWKKDIIRPKFRFQSACPAC